MEGTLTRIGIPWICGVRENREKDGKTSGDSRCDK